MTAVVHALIVLFLVVAFPIWDRRETARLKAGTDPRARLHAYWKTIGWQLAVAAILWATVPIATLFTAPDAGKLAAAIDPAAVYPVLVGLAMGALVPVIVLRLKSRAKDGKPAPPNPLDSIAFVLPHTRGERWWFATMCIAVGICEEIIFRGFLIRYFHALPFGLGVVGAVLLSAAVFGLDHGYQGWKGMLGTFGLALMMTALFFVTRSLWVPIAVHTLIDLRVLLMLPASLRSGDTHAA